MFTPDPVSPKAKSFSFVFWLIYGYIIICIAVCLFIDLCGTSRYKFTDAHFRPEDYGPYSLLSTPQQLRTKEWGFDFVVIKSDYLSIILYTLPMMWCVAGYQKRLSFTVVRLMVIFLMLLPNVVKSLSYTIIGVWDCNNFWPCKSIDTTNPTAQPSLQYKVIWFGAITRILLDIVYLIILVALKKYGEYVTELQKEYKTK